MDFIESCLDSYKVESEKLMAILTACEEIIINIINYSYPDSGGDLIVEIEAEDKSLFITFIDNGIPFNPLEIQDADVNLPLEERKEGGLGILMVKRLMDNIQYERRENKNILKLYKNI
jgi:anti-sigma regulatory factor (Ser/Thr protein kinase)